jgi:outer membrane lipoprotein-sorting protein
MPRNLQVIAGALGLALSLAGPLAAAELEPAPPGVDARQIARRAEDNLRSDTTYLEATMTVESPRLTRPRSVRFKNWDDRPGKRSLIRIQSPAKDEGTGFLKLHPNLWMYVPRVERTLRIPPSMMLQPWMGSDFTNDDLVNESSDIEDYDHRLLGVDPAPEGAEQKPAYVVEYQPHEEVPVVWGRIVAWIDVEHGAPLRQDFYDEDGERLRTMHFGDIRAVDGRSVPHLWEMTPLHKPGHRTTIRIHTFRFDVEIDDSLFTTRQLKQGD